MNKIKLVGIDLAKSCYQVCALDEYGKELYNRKYTAKKFAEAMQQLEPTTVALEACAASHYWHRHNMPKRFGGYTRAIRTMRSALLKRRSGPDRNPMHNVDKTFEFIRR